jgi:hypothetical protein
MGKVLVRLETFVGAGRYQHQIFYRGYSEEECASIPRDVLKTLESLNEQVYDLMPEGSDRLVSEVSYRLPAPSLISRLAKLFRTNHQSPRNSQ